MFRELLPQLGGMGAVHIWRVEASDATEQSTVHTAAFTTNILSKNGNSAELTGFYLMLLNKSELDLQELLRWLSQ